jgi:hypothetical protein
MATERDEDCFLCLGRLDPKGAGLDAPYPCAVCPAAVHQRCVVARKSSRAIRTYFRDCVCQQFEFIIRDIEEHVRWQWKPREASQYWRFGLTLLVCTLLHPLLIVNLFPAYALAFSSVFFLALAFAFDPRDEEHRPQVFTAYAMVSALFGVFANSEIIVQLLQYDTSPSVHLPLLGELQIGMIIIANGVLDFVAALNEWAFAVTSLYFPSSLERASFDYWFGRAGTLVGTLMCILFALETLWNCLFELKTRHVKRKMQ